MLCQATGLRPETAKQIRRSMVKVSEGIIHLPKAILKGKREGHAGSNHSTRSSNPGPG